MSEQNFSAFKLYGSEVADQVLKEIEVLKQNSNIPFDKDLISLGISFFVIKCESILKGEKKHTSLKNLVNESFGEASIYKYQIKGGE